MSDKMKVRDGKDGYSYPYTSPDLVIDKNGKSNTTKFEELDSQFKDIANKIENGNIGNNVEPQLMDMPRIYFSEGTLPTTKTATTLKFDYYSKTKEYHGWAEIKCQGNSSMSYPKKNFTIKLFKDKAKTTKLKIDFKGWGKQSKFVLKANWIDLTHARNVVSARIWGDIVKSRSGYANLPELLRTSPNQGAIDGFPIVVYGNGYYQGRYTLNIPKDKWMSNMDDTLDTHCILCGENYVSGCFRALPSINGSDWTDELHDTVPAIIKTSWTNAIQFVMTSSDSEFKANLQKYFNVESLIDYLLYGILSTGLDAFGKNQIYMTYDAETWLGSMYDMDSTWGLWWNGTKVVSDTYSREEFQDFKDGQGNLLYIRLQQLFINEIKARYAELRQTIFTYPYLVNKFEEFMQISPQDIIKEDYASTTANGAHTGIPSVTANNIQQLRSYINARLTYVDGYINSLIEPIACTDITLDKSVITFTGTDSQILTATLTPSNTTDILTWNVTPAGICTVENGIVTPISNGECVITAKCGEQTAICNINVNTDLSVKELSLDRDNINLNISTVDESTVNLASDATYAGSVDFKSSEIILQKGLYEIKNIGNGAFTWIGCQVKQGDSWKDAYAGVGNTNSCILPVSVNDFKIKLSGHRQQVEDEVTSENFGIFKINNLSVSTVTTPFTRLNVGSLYTATTNPEQYETSNRINVDSSKAYILRAKDGKSISDTTLNIKIDKSEYYWNNLYYFPTKIPLIQNATAIQISCKIEFGLSNIELIEVELTELPSSKRTEKLIATITPTNATNKNVTWTSNNENVELVPDGLNCTVKAKAVGNSVITCTSQDTTNGTISDTCTVTIS